MVTIRMAMLATIKCDLFLLKYPWVVGVHQRALAKKSFRAIPKKILFQLTWIYVLSISYVNNSLPSRLFGSQGTSGSL